MNELKIFENPEFGKVRTITINGNPYFVGKDVSDILGYAETANMRKLLEKDEYMEINPQSTDFKGFVQNGTTLEANPNIFRMLIVSESGLYNAIFNSTLPTAKQFKKWVVSDILPTIRKTGGYVANDDLFIQTYFPFADDNTKAMFKQTLETVRRQNEIIKDQQREIEHKEDVISGLVDEIDLAEKRQILNRVVRHNNANYADRWRILYREFENKYHIDLSRRVDRYNADHKPKCRNKLEYIDRVMNKLPELYELAAKIFENDIKELVDEMYSAVN